VVGYVNRDLVQAERFFRKATEADPNYELGHTALGYILTICGRPTEGRQQLEISKTLAPSKVHILRFIGHTYYVERDYTNALAWYRRILDSEPRDPGAFVSLAETYQAMGDYTNCIENFEMSELVVDGADVSEIKQRYSDLRRALRRDDVRGFWEQQRQWIEGDHHSNYYWQATVQLHLGNTNAAFTLLNRSLQAREENLQNLLFHEVWGRVRDDARYRKLLDEIGLSKVMSRQK
jgi:tetratricopeptide (TPR) repeat protein